MGVSCCLFAAAVVGPARAQRPFAWEPPFIVKLKVRGRYRTKRGKLVIAWDGADEKNYDPTPKYRIYLVTGKNRVRFDKVGSLAGRVEIGSMAAALDYVRLWTSPRSYWLGGYPAEVEPMRAQDLDRYSVLGDDRLLGFLRVMPGTGYGVFPPSRAFPFPPVALSKVGHNYIVKRSLLRVEEYGARPVALDVEEEVSPDGSVRRSVKAMRRLEPPEDWAAVMQRGHLP
jgi:hypothetical protein